MGFVNFGVLLAICLLGVWLRHTQESSTLSGKVVRYSRFIHIYAGLILFICCQASVLSAYYSLDIQIFYALLGYQIGFLVLRGLYRFFPPRIGTIGIDYQAENTKHDLRVIKKK